MRAYIGRDILRVSVRQDLCYLWRNSWIIITIGLVLAGVMDTVLPLCSGCLTGDKQTQLNNNLGAIPACIVTSRAEIWARERPTGLGCKVSSGWSLSKLQPFHHRWVKAAQTSSLNTDFSLLSPSDTGLQTRARKVTAATYTIDRHSCACYFLILSDHKMHKDIR